MEHGHGVVADAPSAVIPNMAGVRPAMAAKRPWVHTTAFGAPVEPEVNSNSNGTSAVIDEASPSREASSWRARASA